jgi:DNA repair protein RadB
MSLQHRSIARLPLKTFEAFLIEHDRLQKQEEGSTSEEDPNLWTPERFRREIALRLSRKQCQTVGSLLSQQAITLVTILDPLCTYRECRDLKSAIAKACVTKPLTGWKMWTDRPGFLKTKLTALDDHLRGGIRKGTLTEVVGSPATGKTQLALQMALDTPTIFIDTENKLHLERLQEIGRARGHYTDEFLHAVSIHTPSNMEEFKSILASLEDELLTRPVGLLVVDSIAAPARREYENAAEQMVAVLSVAQTLKRIAIEYQIGVLLINQVSTTFGPSTQPRAALGTSWHHCVSTRLILEHQEPRLPLRRVTVSKSNIVGPTPQPISFHITDMGLVDPPDGNSIYPGHVVPF